MYGTSKSNAKSRRWSEWSGWVLHPEFQRYYRSRVDASGAIDYEWAEDSTGADNDAATPRESTHDTTIDELADGIAGLQTSNAPLAYDSLSPDYTVASGSRNRSKSAKTKSSSRSKGKQRYYGYDEDATQDDPAGSSRQYPPPTNEPEPYYGSSPNQYYAYPDDRRPSIAASSGSTYVNPRDDPRSRPDRSDRYENPKSARYTRDEPRTSHDLFDDPGYPDPRCNTPTANPNAVYDDPRASNYPQDDTRGSRRSPDVPRNRRYSVVEPQSNLPYQNDIPQEEVDYEREMRAAIAASRHYDPHQTGEASTSAYAPYDYNDEGPPTPRLEPVAPENTHIAAEDITIDQLDPRYRIEPSVKFQPGEIFKILWSEPQGTANEGAPTISDRREFRDRFGGKFFVGFRRFVVIANDLGHCTCVPILTYGGKGCKKRGVKPEKHGIVYERGHKARLLKDEPKLGFPAVRVEIYQEGERLAKESRVNYSKLVTIEHNIKVFFIGAVTHHDSDLVSDAVNKCWEEKIHHKRRHFK